MPITKPSKQQVRDYLATRAAARTPPKSPEEIRRQLGWELCPDKIGKPNPVSR